MNYNERIKDHIDQLFENAPRTARAVDMKEEIYLNTLDHFRDLCAEGRSEEAAYSVAIAGIGDLRELITELKTDPDAPSIPAPGKNPAQTQNSSNRKPGKSRVRRLRDNIDSILWMGTLILYFMLSFGTGAWFITWIVFLIAPAVENIYHAVFDLCAKSEQNVPYEEPENIRTLRRSLSGALWLIMVAIYMLVSFATGSWYISWVIFFLADALKHGLNIVLLYTHSGNKDGGDRK